jgi:hypothetical protein
MVLKVRETINRRTKNPMKDVFTHKDPQSLAEKVTNVIVTEFNGQYYVVAPDHVVYPINDLTSAMLLSLKVHYMANIKYPKGVQSLYGVIEGLCCIKTTVSLGTMAKKIVAENT